MDVRSSLHLAIQGATRSGKSMTVNVLLAGLAGQPLILAGIDPTGILFNPWRDYPNGELRHLGTLEMGAALEVLRRLVILMDDRVRYLMRSDLDQLNPDDRSNPVVLVVLEEYPGILAACASQDVVDGSKQAERLEPLLKLCVRRLIQEGAKVNIRVLIISQRADAAIIDGPTRSNIGTRLSMRLDNRDAVAMLHPNAPADLVALFPSFEPGVGVAEIPGRGMQLFKSDFLEYRDYVEHVRALTPVGDTLARTR
jgi:S-DNA-T family DNA segregation ATPase FtsK/SpoIIIE